MAALGQAPDVFDELRRVFDFEIHPKENQMSRQRFEGMGSGLQHTTLCIDRLQHAVLEHDHQHHHRERPREHLVCLNEIGGLP